LRRRQWNWQARDRNDGARPCKPANFIVNADASKKRAEKYQDNGRQAARFVFRQPERHKAMRDQFRNQTNQSADKKSFQSVFEILFFGT
jgi:hypothetical protein